MSRNANNLNVIDYVIIFHKGKQDSKNSFTFKERLRVNATFAPKIYLEILFTR